MADYIIISLLVGSVLFCIVYWEPRKSGTYCRWCRRAVRRRQSTQLFPGTSSTKALPHKSSGNTETNL